MFRLDCQFPLRTESEENLYDDTASVQIYETEMHDFVVLYFAQERNVERYCCALSAQSNQIACWAHYRYVILSRRFP
ncbi:hypothetical protein J6590_004823 [Homalodisca vitripennis]|nr:hypothetical protein J6590_004823 [Homalodisca vitripennis]